MNVKQLFDRLRSSDSLYGIGASTQEIRIAESQIELVFPRSYELFLTQIGWLEDQYFSIFGLGEDVPSHLELVHCVNRERQSAEPPIPRTLLPLMNDGAGNNFCLDLRCKMEEPPVVFWDHEDSDGPNQVPQIVGSSFFEWLDRELVEVGR